MVMAWSWLCGALACVLVCDVMKAGGRMHGYCLEPAVRCDGLRVDTRVCDENVETEGELAT
jgi:hypothetical protein